MNRAALCITAAAVCISARAASADTVLRVDATRPAPPLEVGYLKMGASVAPSGSVIGINNQYLTRDGQPWLPVMGEFHYTRFPQRYWEEELLKMKAAGVDIVASYIIWQHHEETEGRFDWSGDRELRRFVELCAKHGLYFFARVGPWSHAEVRFGGIPDWVVNAMPTRSDDPTYLSYVSRFYFEIGKQLQGLLWKDGGPIIGVQLENEFNLTGPKQGRQHIATLKDLAFKFGLDAPLYTVTGWDNTVYPSGTVTPVFGGYPDEPWSVSKDRLPPKETYAFRFDSRVSGNLGAQTVAQSKGDADPDIPHTPFLGAEYGGGVPAMYRRRPVIAPEDISAMLPVQLGSGVNLYGYYMFHGGSNPPGNPSREEATAIGGYNDTPMIGYDFGAPLGQYGQAHPVLAKIRPFHYFMRSFGAELAPMTVQKPEVTPSRLDDLRTPRFSVRARGNSGFLFFSNHVRQYEMVDQQDIRFEVKLADGPLRFPSKPIDVPKGAHFIWPLNLSLRDAKLAWATAQPVTRFDAGADTVFVFSAQDGIPVEMAFDATSAASLTATSGVRSKTDGRIIVSGIKPGRGEAVRIKTAGGASIRVIVLTQSQVERTWVATLNGATHLVTSDDEVFFDGSSIEMRSRGDARFSFGVFPALKLAADSLREGKRDGVFQMFESRGKEKAASAVSIDTLREAQPVPPVLIGGTAQSAIQPWPEVFGKSAAWRLSIPKDALDGLNDAFLRIEYAGDVARLFSGTTMIDDHYFNGPAWEIGLKRFAKEIAAPWTLTVLPLRQDAPIYIQEEHRPKFSQGGQIAALASVMIVPEHRLRVTVRTDP